MKAVLPYTDSQRIKAITLSFLQRVLPEERAFVVRLWDGSELPSTQPAKATLVIHSPQAPGRMFQFPLDLSLGEAYLRGDFDIEGDLEAVFAAAETLGPKVSVLQLPTLLKEVGSLRRYKSPAASHLRGALHSKARDREAIQHHYDVSNRFYQLWLDQRMVYSCGYFPTGSETLSEAQAAKLEHICRKLRLKPGERLLDIGCGWGGWVLYAAERYGVQALGITLSRPQQDEARRRVQRAGLEGRVRIELLDYRDLWEEFDKVTSIGMAEHVGRQNLRTYFHSAWKALKPGGLMMHHVITQGPVRIAVSNPLGVGEFMRRYVFPDGEILPLWQNLEAAEGTGFEVRDVEDLREHYARTLRLWVDNLNRSWEQAVQEAGLERARLWRLYMAASAHQFNFAHLALHQCLLAKPGEGGTVEIPASRADLYA
jgi:cyclopropane-fatty-acyl-phospholipid synthase